MTRAHERFFGARVLITFAFAVFVQSVLVLAIIRLGFWGFLIGPVLFLTYIAVFGRAFLLALRRLSLLSSTALRFATPMFCTIIFLFCSLTAGGYIADRLNTAIFHMPVEDFDR